MSLASIRLPKQHLICLFKYSCQSDMTGSGTSKVMSKVLPERSEATQFAAIRSNLLTFLFIIHFAPPPHTPATRGAPFPPRLQLLALSPGQSCEAQYSPTPTPPPPAPARAAPAAVPRPTHAAAGPVSPPRRTRDC